MAGVKRSLGVMLGHGERQAVATTETRRFRSSPSPVSTTDAAARSCAASTPAHPPPLVKIPVFGSDASFVLVGIRGAGKSTLAVISSTAMKRRVVDLETVFQREMGSTSVGYKKSHGTSRCQEQQARVLQDVLKRHRTDCIIICSWMDKSVRGLLREFSATNPVIHVVRDVDAIQDHLKIRDKEKVRSLLKVSHAVFRGCSGFEFFNLSETVREYPPRSNTDFVHKQSMSAPYLTLKKAERHLLKFLSSIYPAGAIPFIESAFPLATIPPEDRKFTYAVSVPLDHLLLSNFDIEEHVSGADVIQIVIQNLSSVVPSKKQPFIELADDLTRGLGKARRSTVLPLIIHIVLPETADEELALFYLDLVAHALRLGPEMVTLDLRLDDSDIRSILDTKGRSKVIGDCCIDVNAPSWDSPFWTSQYNRARRLHCDMVRFVRPAASMDENFTINRMRSAVEQLGDPQIPLIAYNSGALGRNSACFNPTLTVVAPRIVRPPATVNQPCLTTIEATKALYSSFVYDPMKMYVFGANVSYSISPAMHNAAFEACGMPHRYEPYSTDSLGGIRSLIEDPYFGGASVGLPFKVEIITLIHSLSRHAQAIGAVNTLIPVRHLDRDGLVPKGAVFFDGVNKAGPVKAFYGENTDWIGICACIRRGLSPANAVRPDTCGLLIGAGGMARAALYAMLQIGVQNIVIYNRSTTNAEKLAAHFTQLLQKADCQALGGGDKTKFHVVDNLDQPWPGTFSLPTIIISCIPTHRIGDVPAPEFTVPQAWLGNQTGGVIIELGYKTLDTPLLAQARREASRGWVPMDGLDLVPEQGFAQFELFTGRRAPRRVMRRGMLRSYMDADEKSNFGEMEPRLRSMAEQEA